MRSRSRLLIVGVAVVCLASVILRSTSAIGQINAQASPSSYVFKSIDFPDAASTQAFGINERGDVVGAYTDTSGNSHGFRLGDGNFHSIDFPGAVSTAARGINDAGEVVGVFTTSDDPNGGHGFVLRNGKFKQVDYPGSAHSGILGVNEAGDFTGSYDLGDITTGIGYFTRGQQFKSFEVPGSAPLTTGPHGINDEGQVVGFYTDGADPNVAHGFLLDDGKFTTIDYPGASITGFFGINERGDLIGGCTCIDGTGHGLLFSNGQFTIISYPNTTHTRPRGINDRGQIVGFYQLAPTGPLEGFIATPRHSVK